MHAPQVLILILMTIGIRTAVMEHGKQKTGTHNVWTFIIAAAIYQSLLYWGGFYSN